MRFDMLIGDDGELALDIPTFRSTTGNLWLREQWQGDRLRLSEFRLVGVSESGLGFVSDSVSFSSLEERFTSHWSRRYAKPRAERGEAVCRYL